MEDALTSIRNAGRQRNWMQDWLIGQPYAPPEPNETLNDNNDNDQSFAARLYSLCLRLLRYLCQQEQNDPSKRHRVSSLKEELGRLYLWGEAFANGKLDRALEYSDDVRGNVLESLRDIAKLLLRELSPSPTSVLPPISLQKSIQELKSLAEQTKVIIYTRNIAAAPNGSDWADNSDTDQDSSSDDDDTTTIAEELRLQTQWLTQLGPVLEQNLISAQKAHTQVSLPEPVPFSVSGPAKIYVSLVREKYKQAQDKLVERLGEANWQRHISVRNSMKASIDVAEEIPAPVEDSAVSRSLFRPYSTFHDSGIGSSIPAQTEYAPSHTSFQSSNTEGGRELIRVPATPVEVSDGKPFQCFLCKCVLSNIKNRVDWKMHIFADLQPYICTFVDCEDELAQFPNRAAWAEHEFSQHRITSSWSCPECPQAFTSVSGWQSHIQDRHCLVFSGPNLNVAKNMAYKTEATRVEDDECPLCRTVVGKPRRAFVKHVARHMEEIALMALPRNFEEDSEEGSVSTDRTSLEESRTSFHAKPSLETDVIARSMPYPVVTSSTLSHAAMASHHTSPRASDRHASQSWHPENDELLVRARQQGLNWQPIASQYFPNKTANACRKRHERLMERRNSADNWDGVKIETLAKAYVEVREPGGQGSANGSTLPVMPNYEKLTVVELRNELVARGLPKTGLKAALVQRLIEAVAPFACEQCDQKFFKSHELNAHTEVHTRPFRCGLPECSFPGARQRKDLDKHVREEHGMAVAVHSAPTLLPTVKLHTTDQLNHEQDEFIPREYDASGERKVSLLGETLGCRVYNIRTFSLAHRGEKQFMLATECARVLGYRDSYLLFNENRSLYKIIATPQEKDDLINQERIPYSYRSRQIALVTAKSMFRQFGARVIQGGRRVRDDYWEAKAIKQGFTEVDIPGDKRQRVLEYRV